MKKGWNLALPVALVLAGVATMAFVLVTTMDASRANEWGQSRATIQSVTGTTISYLYEAGGRAQRATQSGVRGSYAEGATVLVYVNPANPAESLLQLPPRPSTWPAFAGALSILSGVAIGAHSLRAPSSTMKRLKTKPGKGVRRPAAPMSRLRPPPPVKRVAPDEVPEDLTAAE